MDTRELKLELIENNAEYEKAFNYINQLTKNQLKDLIDFYGIDCQNNLTLCELQYLFLKDIFMDKIYNNLLAIIIEWYKKDVSNKLPRALKHLDINDYLTAVIFTDSNFDFPPGDIRYHLPDNVTTYFKESFVKDSLNDLILFETLLGEYNLKLLIEAVGCENIAYDFWFTRNLHGTGFWEYDNISASIADTISNHFHSIEEIYFN